MQTRHSIGRTTVSFRACAVCRYEEGSQSVSRSSDEQAQTRVDVIREDKFAGGSGAADRSRRSRSRNSSSRSRSRSRSSSSRSSSSSSSSSS